MRSALVDSVTNQVVNIIVAEAITPSPFEGFYMIGIFDETPCNIGWTWNGTDFIDPNPEPIIESVLGENNGN